MHDFNKFGEAEQSPDDLYECGFWIFSPPYENDCKSNKYDCGFQPDKRIQSIANIKIDFFTYLPRLFFRQLVVPVTDAHFIIIFTRYYHKNP